MITEFKHHGIAIEIDGYGRFTAMYDEVEYREATLEGLRTTLDKQIKAKTPKAVLALEVVGVNRTYGDKKVIKGVITGIHRATGKLLIKSDPKDVEFLYVVPLTEKNVKLAEEYVEADNRETRLRNSINEVSIEVRQSYGVISYENYPDKIAKLEAEYKRIKEGE